MNYHNLKEWDNLSQDALLNGLRRATVVGQEAETVPQQEGKMAAPSGQNDGFIDLKIIKVNSNVQHSVLKNSVQPKSEPKTVVQPSEDVSLGFRSLEGQNIPFDAFERAIGFAPVTQRQVLPNVFQDVLPAPTFGSEKLPLAENRVLSHEQKQPLKTFTDGPQLPVFDNKEFGVDLRKDTSKTFNYELKLQDSRPAHCYTKGEVKYTTKGVLKQMVEDLAKLKEENTGCIIDETCDIERNDYIENIDFLVDECMGRGSYGKVDLCYDSNTKKPFVRKLLSKEILRASEIIVPLTVNHDNITKFYGLIQRKANKEGNPTMELLIEYGGCALNKYFIMGHTLTDAQIWDLAKQGLEALAHISHYSIVHLDVKPENMCVSWNPCGSLLLKLTDFGSSRLPQEPLKFCGLTPEYMAPEMCKMFLQAQRSGLNWGLSEADITGKVDTFAFGLVIMYLYKHYHILVKVINNGNTSYEGLDMPTKRLLHMQLVTLMADESSEISLVQNLIPDECDLEMRDLLVKLTEHHHQNRYSARQGLDFIENKQCCSKVSFKPEKKVKDPVEEEYLQKHVPVIALDSCFKMEIPVIAEDCMESDNGPVKNRTKDALRMKLQPYGKSGKKGKLGKNAASGKFSTARESVSEMNELRNNIASKQMPMTPVSEFQGLSLRQHLPEKLIEDNERSLMTERNAPVAQPSMDTHPYPYQVSQPVFSTRGLIGVNPSQQQEPDIGIMEVNPSCQGVPAPAWGGVKTSQQRASDIGFSNANPYIGVEPENNVISLGGKGTLLKANVPQQRAGVVRLEIAEELIQQFLLKKIQEKMKREQVVHPHVVNIPQTPAIDLEQVVQIRQTQNVQLDRESSVEMDAEDGGNLPKFSMFA